VLFVLSTGGSGVCSPLLRFTLSHYYAPPGLVNLRNLYLYRCRRKPHSLVCAALLRFPGEGSAACSQTAQAHVLRAVVPCEEQLQAAPGGLFFARCKDK
jgi:hypothetical protein